MRRDRELAIVQLELRSWPVKACNREEIKEHSSLKLKIQEEAFLKRD